VAVEGRLAASGEQMAVPGPASQADGPVSAGGERGPATVGTSPAGGSTSPAGAAPAGRWFAAIAGGGTAGHVLPALAVARALVRRGYSPSSIHFIGSRRGQERELVPAAGFGVTLLPGRGFTRRPSGQDLAAAAGLSLAFLQSLALLARARPAVLVAVGGYASLPPALAAGALGVPVVLLNADAVPGAANRVLGRFARASAVAASGTRLPRAVVTGTPVREEVVGLDRSEAGRRAAREELGLPTDRVVLAVWTGSLGSRRVNHAVAGLARLWTDRADLALYHVVGRRDWPGWDQAAGGLRSETAGLWYRAVEYEERMPQLLAAADLAVCRAGASTVAELGVTGVPALLVPLPGAPGDHQSANARLLAEAGGAVVMADRECTPESLAGRLGSLLVDPGSLEDMARAASRVGHPDAADRVAALAERWASAAGRSG
jgi:UDP-N-acetylglucosamine--N-acetylmuramyl-(pentapeptide) pyrophosphoryl-undecaprenol N-acetylglucosamine transferase